MTSRETFQAKYAGGFYGDESSLKKRFEELAGEVYDAQTDPTQPDVTIVTDNKTLSELDNNNILVVTADAKTLTLPATTEGLRFFVVNGGAAGTVGITVSPNASDKIMGGYSYDGLSVRLSGTDNKDLVNTKATALKGDYLILVADGVDGWYVEHAVGVWTEEGQVVSGKLDTIETVTANTNLLAAHSGKTIACATNGVAFTLPATVAGYRYKILNTGADGAAGITVSPNSSDKIMGAFDNGAIKVVMSGTDNKDVVNTQATAKNGDYIVLVGDGAAGWYIEDATGVWTEESQVSLGIISEQVTVVDNTVLTAADSGKTYNIATGAKTFTLPLITAANIGMKFRFRNIAADDAIALTISPNASDGIAGTIANTAADSVASGEVGKDLVNTAAGSNSGDWVEIEAVAATKWFITGGVGVWASEG